MSCRNLCFNKCILLKTFPALMESKPIRKQSSAGYTPIVGFHKKIRGLEVLNLPSILELVEYLSSINRVYVFVVRKKLPRKL